MVKAHDQSRTEGLRPYHKPELIRFPLRPEEAVLGFCKVAGQGGPNPGGDCVTLSNCLSPGS